MASDDLHSKTEPARNATRADAVSGAVQKQYTYRYDQAGNRTAEQVDAAEAGASYNNVNQLSARSGAGPMTFEGTVNEAAVVTVSGQVASIDASGRFKAVVNVAPGQQSVPIQATDASGNVTTKQAQLTVTAGAPNQTLTYDFNGNLTGDGARTFTWDAENRLTSVTAGGHTSAWTYNGAGQRMAEKLDGALIKQWVWDGMKPLVELNASNVVTKRFYAQGMVSGATLPAPATAKFFYSRDHLGSIREVTDNSGVMRARYDYDPYGRKTKLSGDLEADFGYTGHYVHAASGLHFAFYRAYDADLARWLSRDPIGERGGINLYGYVNNSPEIFFDPDGKLAIGAVVGAIVGGVSGGISAWMNCGNAIDIASSALWGAAGGALIGLIDPTEGIASMALQAGLISAGADMMGQATAGVANAMAGCKGSGMNWGEVVGSGIGGAIGGAAGPGMASFDTPVLSHMAGFVTGTGATVAGAHTGGQACGCKR